MPTAFMYSRFSSKKQKEGSSLERQHSNIPQWLARHPTYLLSDLTFEDLGKSGWKGDHIKEGGGFAKLLAAVDAGAIKSQDAILVEAVDRAGRLDMLGMLEILGRVLRAGVTIVTLSDDVTYSRESLNGGQIYILIGKIQAAREYSNSISRNLKGSFESRRRLAAQGITPKRTTPAWLTSSGQVIPDVAAQVKLAFELYVSGLGKTVIAKRMRESGVPALAKCSGTGVEGWFRNETVIGRWGGAQVYEPVVDLSMFHRAQLEGEKRKGTQRVKTAKHFLVGLVKCGSCGANYIMRSIGGVQMSMRCRKRQEMQGCDNNRVIPKPILDEVYRYSSPRAVFEALDREQSGVNETAIVAAEVKLLELTKQVQGYVDAVGATGAGIPELVQKLGQVQAEREACEYELAMLKATVIPSAASGWEQQGKVWTLERNDPQRLSAMLRGVGYVITVHGDKTISTSHGSTYRFASVDKKTGSYKLFLGEKLMLIPKADGSDDCYYEPFENAVGDSPWDAADYENLRLQYE